MFVKNEDGDSDPRGIATVKRRADRDERVEVKKGQLIHMMQLRAKAIKAQAPYVKDMSTQTSMPIIKSTTSAKGIQTTDLEMVQTYYSTSIHPTSRYEHTSPPSHSPTTRTMTMALMADTVAGKSPHSPLFHITSPTIDSPTRQPLSITECSTLTTTATTSTTTQLGLVKVMPAASNSVTTIRANSSESLTVEKQMKSDTNKERFPAISHNRECSKRRGNPVSAKEFFNKYRSH